MSSLTCDHVRELLPERDRDLLGPQDRIGVDAHLSVCADCRADLEVIGALRANAASVRVPVGLETRVVAAVRRPAPPRNRAPANLAMAASVVLALLAGGALLRDAGGSGSNGGSGAGAADPVAPGAGATGETASAAAVVAPPTREPLLRGVPALQELSVEELEVLLSELES